MLAFKELPHQSLSLPISSQPFMCFLYYAQCQFNIALVLMIPGTDCRDKPHWRQQRKQNDHSKQQQHQWQNHDDKQQQQGPHDG